jgi:hypothetical protein
MFSFSPSEALAVAGLVGLPLLLLLLGWNVVLAARLRALAQHTDDLERRLSQASARQLLAGTLPTPAAPVSSEQVSTHPAPQQGASAPRSPAQAFGDVAVLSAGTLDGLVRERLDDLLSDPPEEVLEAIDARLAEQVVRLAGDPPEGLARILKQRIDHGIVERLDEMLGDLDEYEDLADALDTALADRLVRSARETVEEGNAVAGAIERGLSDHLERLFDAPEEHADLFEKIDTRLGDWIVGVIRNAEAALPADIAQALTRTLAAGLLARVEAFFEEPGDHEDLLARFDDKLAERIVRLAGAPSAPTAEALDAQVSLFLVSRAERFLARPAEFADLHDRLNRALMGRLAGMLADPTSGVQRRLAELVDTEVQRRQGEIRDVVARELAGRLEGWVRDGVDRAGQDIRQLVRTWLEERGPRGG